jgi:hypothetical protein
MVMVPNWQFPLECWDLELLEIFLQFPRRRSSKESLLHEKDSFALICSCCYTLKILSQNPTEYITDNVDQHYIYQIVNR